MDGSVAAQGLRLGVARRLLLLAPALAGLRPRPAVARGEVAPASTARPYPPRPIPARLLPVPGTVSPALQAHIAAPYPPGWDSIPASAADWAALAERSAAEVAPHLPALQASLGIVVEETRLAGIRAFLSTPQTLPPGNRDRLLLHLHGGGYVLYPGEAGAGEGMIMAGIGRFRVVSLDYRMPPAHPFPAALEDAVAAWRELLRRHDPRRMAIFGSSAGGGLTLATLLRLRAEGLPLPAAVAPGTPWADLAGAGDSLAANAFVDNALVSNSGWVGAAARLYAAGRDLRDPLISPLYGDFGGLPPAIVTSGTRDLLLSDAVRTHRKLRQAGIEASLQVFEGQSHAQYITPGVPETEEAFGEIAAFLGRHLAA